MREEEFALTAGVFFLIGILTVCFITYAFEAEFLAESTIKTGRKILLDNAVYQCEKKQELDLK